MPSLTQSIFRKSNCLSLLASGLILTLGLTYLSGQSVFTADFEAPDYTTGTLVSDPDWSFDSVDLDVQVTAADYVSGLQSLSLTGAAPFDFSRDPLLALPSVIWLDLQLKPIFAEVADLPLSFSADRTAVTGFVKLNTEGEVYAVDGDGQGSGQWLATGSYATLSGDQSQDWLRLTYRLDYNTKTWDLFIGGQMIAADLGFLNTAATSFDQFTLRGDEAQASGFDSFDVRQDNPLYTDADNDAIDDAYEIAHGLNTSLNDRDQDLDFDTLSNLAEYLANSSATNADTDGDGVDDGSELANGADPTVADAYSLSSLPFSEDFESAPLGDFSSSAWSISGSTPQVQDSEAASGTQALSLNADTFLSNAIDGSDESVVWIDVYIRPQLLVTAPSVDAAQGYYFNQDGQALALDGLGDGSGLWQLLDVATAGDWRRVTTKLDYASQTYDLYIDGGRVATGLGFAKVKPFLSELELSGAELTHADALSASATEPAALDNDRDGWDNATETSATTNPEVFDTDADGLADSLEGLWGYDPLVTESGFAQLTETATGSGIYKWSSSFSTAEGYNDGAVNAQQDWIAAGDALIASEQLDLTDSTTADASFERIAGIGETRRLWISFRAKLVPGALPDIASLNEPAVAIWGFSALNTLQIWNQQDQDWQSIITEADATEWNDYALYFDYVEQEWLLTINGALVASDVPFVDEDLIVFSRFKALQAQYTETRSSGPYTASFDDFVFSTTEPAWLDYDGDGLLNSLETQLGSDFLNSDSDADGMDDLYEYQNGLNLLANDTSGDLDGDGLNNLLEFGYGTLANAADSDGDGIQDHHEVKLLGSDPLSDDSSNFMALTGYDFDEINAGLSGAAYQSVGADPRYYLMASGVGVQQARDRGHYVHRTVTGDFSFTVRLHSITGGNNPEFSLMLRESLGTSSDMAVLLRENVVRHFRLYQRGLEDEDAAFLTGKLNFQYSVDDAWMKLSRKGETVYSYASQDGVSWYLVGSSHAPESETLELGVFASSGKLTNRIFAEYSVLELLTDADQDGIWDTDESGYGTSATEWDSDGDGYSDYDEIYQFYSDPTLADLGAATVADSEDGSATVATLGTWVEVDGATYALGGRGAVEYDLNVSQAAIYRLNILGQSRFNYTGFGDYSIKVEIDGVYIGRIHLGNVESEAGYGRILTPWLPAGVHRVRFFIDNTYTYRSLQVDSVSLEYIGGDDLDLDGHPDWMQSRLAANNSLANVLTGVVNESAVSPFCLTGHSRYLGLSEAADPAIELNPLPAYDFYTDVDLTAGVTTSLDLNFENQAFTETVDLSWVATDVLSTESITIRKGDSLLLTALDVNDPSDQAISISIDAGVALSGTESSAVEQLFDTAGSFTVSATVGSLSGTMSVEVLEADFGSDTYELLLNKTRTLTPSTLSDDAEVSIDESIHLSESAQSGARNFNLTALESEPSYMAARLPNSGAVLDHLELKPFYIASDNETHVTVVETFEDGDQLISTNIILDYVPDDLLVSVSIFVSGVTFADGSIVKTLTAADFDELGRVTLYFIKPAGTKTSICHRIAVSYDGEESSNL